MNEKKTELLDQRLVVGQFCDDVRLEVGNKLSLIGCYGDEMVVQSFPVTLPKLAAQAKAKTALRCPFERLTFKLTLQSNTLAQVDAPPERLKQLAEFSERAGGNWMWVAAVMIVSPLVLTEECEVLLFAETESGQVQGGALKIRGPSQPEAAQAKRPAAKRKRKRKRPAK